ncbi:sensor histidine kinase [Microbispora sp. NPDC049125]|uniref:sensor histidine kinase n=1 Tax=Microbispora sp. NPDC049125 TaxID=3154929 RepID=UPI0034678A54
MTTAPQESAIDPAVLRLALIALFVVAQAGTRPGFGLSGRELATTVLTLAVAAATAGGVLPFRRRDSPEHALLGVPLKVVSLCVAVVLSIVLLTVTGTEPAVAALLFLVGAAAVRHPLRHSLPVEALALVGLLVPAVVSGNPGRDLSLCLSTGLVFLIAYSIRQRRATRTAEAREAVLAERARIAREIHDILAHSLSAQIVHLEGARLLLRADRAGEALERVDRARELAKSGLEEARRAVSALREDVPPLTEALRALAEEFRVATGQECVVEVSGAERRLPAEAALAVIRTAQEALTNVRRHAPGSPAAVRLGFDDGTCELEVANPAGDPPGSPGGGYGLMGMRERAELLGGTLETGKDGQAFRVRLRIPS